MAEETIRVTGLNKILSKIDKLAQWSVRDSEKLQEIGHRVGDVYANYLSANVKDYSKPIIFRGKKIQPGTLRRSSGTWLPDKNSNIVLAGPRTNAIGRRKTRRNADGFYAHIVEKGDFGPRFGGKHRTQNTGVFSRGLSATKGRSEKLQFALLKKEFARYVKRA